MGAKPKFRRALCPKCGDNGFVFEWEHPGRKHKLGMARMIPCRKNCVASRRWIEEQKAKKVS